MGGAVVTLLLSPVLTIQTKHMIPLDVTTCRQTSPEISYLQSSGIDDWRRDLYPKVWNKNTKN